MASGSNLPPDGAVRTLGELKGRNWVSLKQFAIVAEMSYQVCLKLVWSGKIRAIKVGGTYRIYEEEVRRFLREGNHPNPIPLE